MKRIAFTVVVLAAACYLWQVKTAFGHYNKTGADSATEDIVSAANVFLQSLTDEQRTKMLLPIITDAKAIKATFERKGGPGGPGGGGKPPGGGMPFNNDSTHHPPGGNGNNAPGAGMGAMPGFTGEQYGQAVWSNYPVSDVPRPGLQMGSLTTAQHNAAIHLLQVLLSNEGYEKVQEIMGSDQVLADSGTPFASGKDKYTIAIFGNPSKTNRWMVQFGGHHLALNIVIAGSKGSLTPALTGAQPAVYTTNGKTVRVLAQENDKAFALLATLSAEQQKKAILNYRIDDLVLGPGHDGETIVPEGLPASAMNDQQRAMLLDLISEWADIINTNYLPQRLAEITSTLNDTYFAWSGPTTHQPGKNGSSYYRIQGPRVIIEFSPQGVGGDQTMHVHTIYRDPANEYGSAFITK